MVVDQFKSHVIIIYMTTLHEDIFHLSRKREKSRIK